MVNPQQVAGLDGSCTLTLDEIGGKAWGVNHMRRLGLPVPPAMVITTFACREYYASGRTIQNALWEQIVAQMKVIEEGAGRHFGATQRPLLVAVRSGAVHSMPGMMDTVLNLGINAAVEAALASDTKDARYAADTHRRFIEQYRKVVLGGRSDPVPTDPWDQLRAAVAAVFDSWNSPRARVYRGNRGLADDSGTAVTIQAMVFGNLDEHSGTGVLFSRNPITGETPAWGEWLRQGQGEDVVAGGHTPMPLDALRDEMPNVHAELMRAAAMLEADARDIQDIEFTVESGRLWLLQTRSAKRSPQAAVRAAVAFAEEGIISKQQAVRRLSTEQARQLTAPKLAPEAAGQRPLAVGEAACPGVASGIVVTDPEEAETRGQRGEDVILARAITSPNDLHGIIAARGLMTEQGGATSHAAVVSRELGHPCVVGCGSNSVTSLAGQPVTLDGTTGRIFAGSLAIEQTNEDSIRDVQKLIDWGMALTPLRIVKAEDARENAVDLDTFGDEWRTALKPGITVRGSVLETDQGVRAARDAGVCAIAVRHRLPALLASLKSAPDRADGKPAQDAVPATPSTKFSELTLLRLLALKGRATPDVLADSLALTRDVAAAAYTPLCQRGWCETKREVLRLTDAGQRKLASLLAEEHAQVDPAAVLAWYEEFCVFNEELKQVMTAWQVAADGSLNDHLNADYDRAVLQRLADLHARADPLMRRLAQLSPRLAIYPLRLARAHARITAGDHSYVAKIIADSYHTVWFELHKELISLAGLNHDAGARAGNAT